MARKVILLFCNKRYGREASKRVEVAYSDWDEAVMDWLWPALERFARVSELNPPHLTNWDQLSHGLPALAQVPSWRAFTQIPIPELEMDVVRDLFMDLDDAFHRIWGSDRGALRSARVRAFLSDHLLALRPDGVVMRANKAFRPKGRANHTPRPLISDQVRREDGVAIEAPLGAIPHANPAELKASQLKRLKADLQCISDACCKELDSYDQACAVQATILADEVVPVLAQAVLGRLKKGGLSESMRDLSHEERRALIAHYLEVDSRLATPFKAPGNKGGTTLAPELARRMGIEALDFHRCLRYGYYPHQTVLVAAIVLIQIGTGWNVSSVIELERRNIHPSPDGGYLIQSKKTKTGDDTPMVLIEGRDSPTARALRFALNRLAALQRRGWADVNEQCLWLSSESNYDGYRGLAISNLAAALRKIRTKYSLPYFTFEMVRTQKLTIVSVDNGPIAAAEMAGHSSFGSIGGYIDHLITQRVNSSVNLEFQRRWEAEVAARIEMQPLGTPLVPVGDGTSCLDPTSPPDNKWLAGGVCDGANCHLDGGCAKRKLVIDPDRIEEAVLTSRYYSSNWRRLHAENPEAFALIHVPRLEFNFFLIGYLKKGPYRHLVNV